MVPSSWKISSFSIKNLHSQSGIHPECGHHPSSPTLSVRLSINNLHSLYDETTINIYVLIQNKITIYHEISIHNEVHSGNEVSTSHYISWNNEKIFCCNSSRLPSLMIMISDWTMTLANPQESSLCSLSRNDSNDRVSSIRFRAMILSYLVPGEACTPII